MQTGLTDPLSKAITERETARQHLRLGRLDQAEQVYSRILETHPQEIEALAFLAGCALRRGESAQGIGLLEQACRAQPEDAQILGNLGIAYDHAGREKEAIETLRRALAKAPDLFLARLHLGGLLEKGGQDYDALVAYFGAITTARRQGQWLSEATTPTALHDKVLHAMRYGEQGRRRLFSELLTPLRARHGGESLRRVEQCLAAYLGDVAAQSPDSRQRPKFLYFPGLPARPYLDRAGIPWLAALEQQTETIRTEARSVLQTEQGLEPFLKFSSPDEVPKFLRGAEHPPAWDAFFFYRHGEHYADNARRCPHTSSILESLPLVRIREHAPEICFSVLKPGTTILPHHGVTNTRIVVHLPLIVPEDCALRVAGEARPWQEGQGLVFDDTYEHEAWNHSDQTRVILLMDAWHPELTEVERAAIADLVISIGGFNRDTQSGPDTH